MVMSLRTWISDLRTERASVEAEARRLIARHGANAPVVAKALAGGPGKHHTGFGVKVLRRVEKLAKGRDTGRP
ncbi:hypothetical protein [Methylobacterium gnaphalii]|uniref:Uncharacterized protein n=1 Tax=Methylobacterium gnaphalii TaxID=1010610 RepID=A0A512JHV0_9HYPH|nr:hypothetical protein [Methylobacterium gnaphalii]GEP09535.1 hypothetical protein MGN01_13800 [Methylobacterium gnaphalii]GJD69946.1 hypothetical protein MMMDOFMJ_2885 [Methylobacterium gnaphalii]GLS48167.1 hypothetical protein GCM10007885_10110 [Methylobacterium gnaphalii]